MQGLSVDEKALLQILTVLKNLGEDGHDFHDARRTWCPDWNECYEEEVTESNLELKAQSAKQILLRLKSARKALETMSSSLENVFEIVTERSTESIRSAGFSSLPDDLLARVFELHHEDVMANTGSGTGMASVSTSNVLAQVCRRFRRIALHIPKLWEDICNYHRNDWILNLKGRCEHPVVFIAYDIASGSAEESIANLLQIVHPANQWRALEARFTDRSHGHDFFERITTMSKGDLRILEILNIFHDWDRCTTQIDTVKYDDTEAHYRGIDDNCGTNFSEVDSALFSQWNLPKLKCLRIENFIPSRVNCSNLVECNLELSFQGDDFNWDLRALKIFLQSIVSVEKLKFSLWNARTRTEYMLPEGSKQIRFECLKFLTIEVGGNTDENLLWGLTDMMDLTTVTDLDILMVIRTKKWYDDDPPLEYSKPAKFLNAIFAFPSNRREETGRVFKFPNVETLRLDLKEEGQDVPFDKIFEAVPRTRDLSLELPHCGGPDVSQNLPPCKNLRNVCFTNCTSFSKAEVMRFFKNRGEEGDWEISSIQRIEIEGCNALKDHKDDFKKIFGDKLVWE
ncbi:hypothetical protein SCHPADRAFT_992412, partial [Schizopora paradoxa]